MNWYHGPNADIVAEARSYLGVRWQHQGRSREGVDCIGLPIVVSNAVRGTEYRTPDYGRTSQDEAMIDACKQYLLPIGKDELQPGDVIVVGFGRQRHMAIIGDYLYGGLSMIHAHLLNRQVVEARLDSVWSGRILAAFRFPGVA
ncbi:MAG: C40 family peptidase [Burkholderiaceae bacterium]